MQQNRVVPAIRGDTFIPGQAVTWQGQPASVLRGVESLNNPGRWSEGSTALLHRLTERSPVISAFVIHQPQLLGVIMDCKLPSHHQIDDRVSLKFGEGYVGADVVGVFFSKEKVLYTVVTDEDVILENVDSAIVVYPVEGTVDA